MHWRDTALCRALRDEDGGAMTFGMLSLMIVALILGLAIDTANLYRQQNLMWLAADAAAHAGAAALARGEGPKAAQAAAAAMVALNLPEDHYGRLISDSATDLRALTLDPVSHKLLRPSPEAPANAMLVRLQRSAAVDNPIPTILLHFVGVDSWTAGSVSVASVQPTRRCANAAGIFVHGRIEVSGGSRLGPDACLHSQTAMNLPADVGREESVRLSLPTLAACEGDCRNRAGLAEMNLVMPQTRSHVARMAAGFTGAGMAFPEKAAFFATRPIATDLEPLAEVGTDTGGLRTGSVISLSALRFSALREVPAGLVYLVTCDQPADEVSAGSIDYIRMMGLEDQAKLRDMVLVTSCPLGLDDQVRIEGALVILLHGATTVIDAAPGARTGDPEGTCDARRRSVLMTMGSLALPAGLSTSNLAVVAGGDVMLDPDPETGRAVHAGLALHVGGSLAMEGAQSFTACQGAADPLLPVARVIAHAMPPLEGWVGPLVRERPATEMPGTKVEKRLMEGSQVQGS